ncbi:uncharacterized protein B4U79_17242 [Dinothrombium tinctorium]|uniref:MYND-type domain-containing protein n=1 Tax=Dinothrombium tinctorium TaxID=1965070 RepID=A0A3S3PLK0_9ACAR|nr:uncharacterized protein B4U79_17676 [Dinothrombium tinctorium]RWS15109.1 uncharacterized protein B4U79_17242 [Dinothrombium tinctorium]
MFGNQWPNDRQAATDFIHGFGNLAFEVSGNLQKLCIESGDLNTWNFSTISNILLNSDFTHSIPDKNKSFQDQLSKEKELISQLTHVHSIILHSPNQRINADDFEYYWYEMTRVLVELGEPEQPLYNLKYNLQLSQDPIVGSGSNELTKRMQQLQKEANRLVSKENFVGAIDKYSEAIKFSSIGLGLKTEFLCKRSELHLRLKHILPEDKCEYRCHEYLALFDAKQVISFRPYWWRGYFQLGLAYSNLRKFEKALLNFERSLAIDPTNELVRKERDVALFISNKQKLGSYSDNFKNFKDFCENRGIEFLAFLKKLKRSKDSLSQVLTGMKHEEGYQGIKVNFEVAAQNYRQAAQSNSPFGQYKLGLLTFEGKGVEQNIPSAIELFKKAAEQVTFLPSTTIVDPGIYLAQFALAIIYEHGIVEAKNKQFAFEFYQKALVNGCAPAAAYIGLMYLEGDGVSKDEETARKYFITGAKGKCLISMKNLAHSLLRSGQFELAIEWYNRMKESCENVSDEERKIFLRKVVELKKRFKYDVIVRWELDHSLRDENLNLINRILRFEMFKDKAVGQASTALAQLKSRNLEAAGIEINLNQYSLEYIPIIIGRAREGSTTALKIIEAFYYYVTAADAFDAFMQTKKEEQAERFINYLANGYSVDANCLLIISREKALELINSIIMRDEQSQLDINARICKFVYSDLFEEQEIFLKECILKYPKESTFVLALATIYRLSGRHSEALSQIFLIENQRELNCDEIYSKALSMRHHLAPDVLIMEFMNYLLVAPKDHPKYPEVLYLIAECNFCKENSKDLPLTNVEEIKPSDRFISPTVRYYYKKALEAELNQLPCFLPYNCSQKRILELIVDDAKKVAEQKGKGTQDANLSEIAFQSLKSNHLIERFRIETIVNHRKKIFKQSKASVDIDKAHEPASASKRQMKPSSSQALTEISFREMDPTKDHIYEGRMIEVKFIERPISSIFPSIHTVVEDRNGDVLPCWIYDFRDQNNDEIVASKFGIGCKVRIINPYFSITSNGLAGLLVQEQSCLHFLTKQKVKDMCLFCGAEDAQSRCGKCNKALYCDQQCQLNDWKLYKHKMICQASFGDLSSLKAPILEIKAKK